MLAYAEPVATFVRFVLRLDHELHARLVKLAQREHRSLHAQLLHFIEEGLERAGA